MLFVQDQDGHYRPAPEKLVLTEANRLSGYPVATRNRDCIFREMFRGSINKATVHPREVIKDALQLNAAAIIIAHNHPSGESRPSDQDIELTNKLKDILQVIDVRVLDHLVTGDEVAAFSDLGLLQTK